LTFVQFVNPTPNWYALFLTVVVIALLAGNVQRSLAGIAAIGFVVGMLFMFRQLSGVFVGMGVVAFLVLGDGTGKSARRSLVASLTAGAAALGLAAYLWLKADVVSFVLFGACPLAVLVLVVLQARLDDRQAVATLAALAAGAGIAALPLVIYHLLHGSLAIWWHDTVVSAVSLVGFDFFGKTSYLWPLAFAARGLVRVTDPAAILNGVFWLAVLLSPLVLGVAMVRAVWRSRGPIEPLAFLAVFYGLVAVHYAIPIYALYPAALVFAGLLAIAPPRLPRRLAIVATVFVIAVGLVFQAGQPVSRGLAGIVGGERITLDSDGLQGASVAMEKSDETLYRDVLAFIGRHAAPDDTILGLPMTPELYFLSGRRPPVRFAITALGLLSDADVEETTRRIATEPPAVVVFKTGDKYTTAQVRKVMDFVQARYRLCVTIGPFELFALTCGEPEHEGAT
jgi:hypothetical protein